MNQTRWLLCLSVALLMQINTGAQGPAGIISRESDERAISAGDRQSALTALLNEADRLRAAQQPSAAARLLTRAGYLQLKLAQPAEALRTFNDALRLVTDTADIINQTDTLNGIGAVYTSKTKCPEAKTALTRALSLSDQDHYLKGRAQALLTLSECQDYDNHTVALATANESLAIWTQINHQWGIAKTNAAIGIYLFSLNQLTEATVHFETALHIWRALALTDEQADLLISLSFIEYRKGAWQNNISDLTEARTLIDEQSEPYKLGQINANLGETYIASGLPEAALPSLDLGLQYFERAQNPRAVSAVIWVKGKALLLLNDLPHALEQFNAALAGFAARKEGIGMAICHEFLGRTYFATGDAQLALTHYQEAITLYQAADDRMKTARATALRGQAFQQQGKIEPARAAFLAALDGFRSLSDQFNLGATLYALGQLELNQDRLDLAENYLQESIRVTENVRRGAQVTDLTSSFSATVYDRYELLVECLMRQQAAHPDRGFAAQAFEASELGRGRSLAELLRATDTNLSSRVEPELAQHERSLRQMLRVKAEQQAELLGQSSIDKAALDALKNEQAQLENEYGQVTDQIRQRYPAFGEIVRPVAWTLREIQTQVLSDDQTVLLEYSFGEDQSYVWAVTRTSFASYELPGRAQINQAAQRVYKLLSQEPGANTATELNAASEELSRMILAPLAGQLNKSRIIVVADGALHYIPFQILLGPTDKNGPLVANHEVVDAPSASILGELRNEAARRRAPAKLLAAFGDPIFQLNYAANKDRPGSDQVAQVQGPETDRWRHVLRDIELNGDTFDPSVIKPLFHAEEELTNISKLATGRDLLLASKFSASREQLLRTDLTQFAILHIATHGFLDPKRPENSGLVLSTVDREGKPQNGFVGLQDIYGLNAPVDLVVLSACQTGLGKDVRGEGLIGLTRGFMYAGASTVVASLWKVDDEVTAELMKQFYINMLQKGMTPAAALRGAQNSIRQRPEWSAPYYWAAFTLQGEYREVIRPVQASGFAAQYGKIVVGGVVLVMLLGAAHWVFGRRGRAATV